MQLDNFPLQVTDRVFDIVRAEYGDVVEVSPTAFTVEFAGGMTLRYMVGGLLAGKRRVYWHNPIQVAPPKDQAEWLARMHVLTQVSQLIEGAKT